MLAKPEPYKRVVARRRRRKVAARAKCRAIVFALAGGRCARCRNRVSDSVPEWSPYRAHVNELVPRSKGGDPTNPDHCELLCQDCHMPNGRHAPTAERLAILRGEQKGKA